MAVTCKFQETEEVKTTRMPETVYEDNDYISGTVLPWDILSNSTMLITGANGLVGSAVIRAINALNKKYALNIRIIAHTRKTHGDICSPLLIDGPVDYIFHCAAITKSADMARRPLEVIKTSIEGTKNVLDFARLAGCKSVVYLSSMEVYGRIYGEVTENMLGYIDLENLRNCYPESKRMCEMLCNAYYQQFAVPVKIARLAQTFGAGTPKSESRVFAQFAKAAMNKREIVLHTEGKSQGNYCYIADTVSALFTLLLKGENSQAYNISNPETCMTIYEMAQLVADEYGTDVVIEIPPDPETFGYAPTAGYKLNIDKIRSLGWKPKYNLLDCYKRMIAAWKEDE